MWEWNDETTSWFILSSFLFEIKANMSDILLTIKQKEAHTDVERLKKTKIA